MSYTRTQMANFIEDCEALGISSATIIAEWYPSSDVVVNCDGAIFVGGVELDDSEIDDFLTWDALVHYV